MWDLRLETRGLRFDNKEKYHMNHDNDLVSSESRNSNIENPRQKANPMQHAAQRRCEV